MIGIKQRLEAIKNGFRYDLANRLWIYGQLRHSYLRLLEEAGLPIEEGGDVKFGITEIGGEPALHLVMEWRAWAPGADKLALCRQAERKLMEQFVPDGMDLLRSDICAGNPAAANQD